MPQIDELVSVEIVIEKIKPDEIAEVEINIEMCIKISKYCWYDVCLTLCILLFSPLTNREKSIRNCFKEEQDIVTLIIGRVT